MNDIRLNITMEVFSIVTLALIISGCAVDPERKKKKTRIFMWLCGISIGAMLSDIAVQLLEGNAQNTVFITLFETLTCIFCVCIAALIIWLVHYFVREGDKKHRKICHIFMILIAANLIFIIVAAPLGWIFSVVDGKVEAGRLYLIYYLVPLLGLIFSLWSVLTSKKADHYEKLSFAALAAFYTGGIVSQIIYPASAISFATGTLSALAVYISFYVRRGKQLAQAEAELSNKRMSAMISQMQPHFLFNSLTTIVDLCDRDPQLAKRSIVSFSDYLRGNLDAMTTESCIPFKKELEHCKTYLSFEKLRFEDQLEIVYDIDCTDFSLPALSVQPLLENAVKHGVGHKDGGGMVVLSVKRMNGYIMIKVLDDGVGFDPDAPLSEGRSHIGIENVRSRLATMCGGTLRVSSMPGKGTTAEIRIPEEVRQ